MDQGFTLIVILDEQRNNAQNWAPLHQCLLMLFDSPLNHAAHLQVYIRLADTRLIKMHREVRIPRTFKRFEQLFCNFLQGCDMPVVQTKDGHVKLLQFVGKSITKLIPNNCQVYRISNLAPKLRCPNYFANKTETSKRLALFIEFGPVDFNILGQGRETDYEIKTISSNTQLVDEETISISRYPLAPSLTCVKIASAFEKALEVF